MIASLFSKSKPFNFIFVGVMFTFSFFLYHLYKNESQLYIENYLQKGVLFLCLATSFFLLTFIAKKNNLSKDSSYLYLFLFLFFLFFPSVFLNIKLCLSSFFILLAIRRLVSLQSLITPKEKIFDASFWIFLATIFHFWAIIFVLLIFVSIIFHVSRDYRNWIIPFLAFLCVITLFLVIATFLNIDFYSYWQNQIIVDFNFNYNHAIEDHFSLSIYAAFAILFLFSIFHTLAKRPLVLQASYKKIIIYFFLSVLVFLFSPQKNNQLLLFSIYPTAVLATAYIEIIEDKIWKEIIVWCMVICAVVIFISKL